MTKYPDRYVITALVADGDHKGERVYLRWAEEAGGWWYWGPEARAYRFESRSGDKFDDAVWCAQRTGRPQWYAPDLSTIEVRAVPAIVEVVVR
jgi:hypothetical protein